MEPFYFDYDHKDCPHPHTSFGTVLTGVVLVLVLFAVVTTLGAVTLLALEIQPWLLISTLIGLAATGLLVLYMIFKPRDL